MEIPRTNAVGLLEVPDDYHRSPRRHSKSMRLAAGFLAAIFTAAVVGTGAASLARYCLTSHAGAPFPFEATLPRTD